MCVCVICIRLEWPLSRLCLRSAKEWNLSSLCLAPYLSSLTHLDICFSDPYPVDEYYDMLRTFETLLPTIPLLETFHIDLGASDDGKGTRTNTTKNTEITWKLPRVKNLQLNLSMMPRLIAPLLIDIIIGSIYEDDISQVLFDTCHAKHIEMDIDTDDILFLPSALLPGDYFDKLLFSTRTVLSVTKFRSNGFPTRLIRLLSLMEMLEEVELNNMMFPSYDTIGQLVRHWPMIHTIDICDDVINIAQGISPSELSIPTMLPTTSTPTPTPTPTTSPTIITLSSLQNLRLFGWNQELVDTINCPKLKTLVVKNTDSEAREDVCMLTNFLNNCPLLEEITLWCPFKFTNHSKRLSTMIPKAKTTLDDLISVKTVNLWYPEITIHTLATLLSSVSSVESLRLNCDNDLLSSRLLNMLAGVLPLSVSKLYLDKISVVFSLDVEGFIRLIHRCKSLTLLELPQHASILQLQTYLKMYTQEFSANYSKCQVVFVP
jgi:hypothetical protein